MVTCLSVFFKAFVFCVMLMSTTELKAGGSALIIANQAYGFAPLETPLHDAQGMTNRLEPIGFDVTKLTNASQSAMYETVDNFFKHSQSSDVLFIYYAGHAVQVNGRNFIVPADATIDSNDILTQFFDIRYLIDGFSRSKARTKILILDACRDTMFSKSPNAASGLAELKAPPGTLIAYSTMPGATAEDGEGENSPYTAALLDVLFTPKVKIEDAFKEVRRRVMHATNNAQVPTESSLLLEDFYLVGEKRKPALAKVGASSAHFAASVPTAKNTCARILAKLSMGLFPLSAKEKSLLAECQ